MQKGTRGQVLVMVAFMMLFLIALAALVTDIGQILLTQRKLQTGVDLAALAGGTELASSGDPGQATSVALDYAERNGLQRSNTTVRVNRGLGTVEVESTVSLRLFFPFIWGYAASQVTASGTAGAGGQSEAAFDYVLFSGSTQDNVRLPGSNQVADGNVHVNGNLVIPGAYNSFNGTVEIAGSLTDSYRNNTFGRLVNPAAILPIPQYDMQELRQQATQVYNSSVSWVDIAAGGIIFVDGDVNISGHHMTGRGTIVATGNINISSSDFQYESANDLVTFYALGSNISLSGSGGRYDGIWYAPNGEIRLSGSYNTVYGSMVAQRFAIPGSGNHFTYDPRAHTTSPGGTGVRLIH